MNYKSEGRSLALKIWNKVFNVYIKCVIVSIIKVAVILQSKEKQVLCLSTKITQTHKQTKPLQNKKQILKEKRRE